MGSKRVSAQWFSVSVNDDGVLTLTSDSSIIGANQTEMLPLVNAKGAIRPDGIFASVALYGALPGEPVRRIECDPSDWLAIKASMNAPAPKIDQAEFMAFKAWQAAQAKVAKVA